MNLKKLLFKIILNPIKALSFVLIFATSVGMSAQCPASYPFLEAINAGALSADLTIQDNDTVGNVEDGSFVAFNSLDITCADQLSISAAAPSERGYIEVRLGGATGTIIGESPLINTGSWGTFSTILIDIDSSDATGSDTIYFMFRLAPDGGSRYLFNIDAFQFINTTPLSVDDVETFEVSIYPNPASDLLFINLENNSLNSNKTKISLYNVAGQKVKETELTSPKMELNVSSLSSGLYILNIKDDTKSLSKRIIKL
ncbi:T9SS type A sorting domain-containing protein [Formosa algae]|uniref:CBM6 domain-containing protein n=1 Tax=Formosa algae TaxID=225843 RepID=A0A9X0YLK2_9FLAO|nr:T9SS type A sorting domain-containing protein [Formosa algae]MBP1841275.1 hypothetical protein [Formosa algae]MDQ0336802.1 hypothetical protein [Formosa algae]OEI80574.1 hypothetical protein AST99_08625 [Formosa algae]